VDGRKVVSVITIGSTKSNIDVTLSGLGITGGSTYYGGGINKNGRTTIQNCLVFANSAIYDGGGIYNSGTVAVIGSLITGNTANSNGGGIWNNGIATVVGSTITGNSAYLGGGICNFGSATVIGSTISGNTATGGGGIYNCGTATVIGSTIYRNMASDNGGGVYNDGTMIIKKGSCIFLNIADSDAKGYGKGGGIYKNFGYLVFQDQLGRTITDPNVISSIVFSNYLKYIGGTLSNIN
jgi:hypothetical protein